MKNQIFLLDEPNRKVFGYTDQQIIFSSKKHSTFESLLASTIKSGMLEDITTVPIDSIKEISLEGNVFRIIYDKNGASKNTSFLLENVSVTEAVVADLASMKNLTKNVTFESKTTPLVLNLLGLTGIIFFAFGLRHMAIRAQEGHHYVATGKKSGIRQLVADAIEAIGPTGIMVLGAIAFIYMIYRTYSRYNKPSTVIKYN